jgi:hypothetical protein
MRYLLVLLAMLVAGPAMAQGVVQQPMPDVSTLATKSEVATVSSAAAAAQTKADAACVAVPAVPGMETVSGAAGTNNGQCRPRDSVQPRITRATNCTLAADGTCSVTWATPLTGTPQIVTTPVNSPGTQPITCNLTAAPTASSASIKCWIIQTTTLSLAIVTTGLNLAPATTAPAGTVVQLIALPPTQ